MIETELFIQASIYPESASAFISKDLDKTLIIRNSKQRYILSIVLYRLDLSIISYMYYRESNKMIIINEASMVERWI